MATQQEKLARALEALHKATSGDGLLRSSHLSRTYRERLLKAGFLEEVINGWLLVSNPSVPSGSSAVWFGAFWDFVSKYLADRFGERYCLSAEASVRLHVGSTLIPKQVRVMAEGSVAQVVTLKHDTTIAIYPVKKEVFPSNRTLINGVWCMDLPSAICRLSEAFYKTSRYDAEIALRMVRDPSTLLDTLLGGSNVVVAGRLVGAFSFLGEERIARQIRETMDAAGSPVRVSNPFENSEPILKMRLRPASPYVWRIQTLWAGFRPYVLEAFKNCPTRTISSDEYLIETDRNFAFDAYNSLSIEGYRVTPELIERIRTNEWNPETSDQDRQEQNALAARGYYLAYQVVKQSVKRILDGESSAHVIDDDFQGWYREMFSPAVRAGMLRPQQLAGYRRIPVCIRGARHVPPPADSVLDCMEALFELLKEETEPSVRAVLGHYIFVFIHPYTDGNGRLSRFLMNAAFAGGGYPWTVVRLSEREHYLSTLADASDNQNIQPFADFLAHEMNATGRF